MESDLFSYIFLVVESSTSFLRPGTRVIFDKRIILWPSLCFSYITSANRSQEYAGSLYCTCWWNYHGIHNAGCRDLLEAKS